MTPPSDARPGETTPCCAHLRITHATRIEPRDIPATADFPGGRLLVNVAEWWECLDCGRHFQPAPLSPPAERGVPIFYGESTCRACGEAHVGGIDGEDLGNQSGDCWKFVAQPAARGAEAFTPLQEVGFKTMRENMKKRTRAAHPEPTPDAALREAATAFVAMYDRYQLERGNIFWLPDQFDALKALRAALAQEGGR